MTQSTKESRNDEKDTLQYWVGSVDATLANLTMVIREFIRDETTRWDEFRLWRDAVNSSLSRGDEQSRNHGDAIRNLEKSDQEMILQFMEHKKDAEAHHKVEANNVDRLAQFVTWSWIRDKIIVPVIVWGIIFLLGYLVVNAIPMQ